MSIVLKTFVLCKSNEEECCFQTTSQEIQSIKVLKLGQYQFLRLKENSTYIYSALLRKVSKTTSILRS